MHHLLILNVVREAAFQTCICSLIAFNSFFVLYLMCCFGNNPLYMDFTPIKIMFCSVIPINSVLEMKIIIYWSKSNSLICFYIVLNKN